MGNSTTTDFDDVIESAMRRIPPASATDPSLARNSLGRRDYDQALAHRLAQLKTAMGEEGSSQATRFIKAPEVTAPGSPRPHRFSLGALLFTALISAAGGGALGFAYLDRQQRTSPQPAPLLPAPVVSMPTPAPAAAAPLPDHVAEIRLRLEAWRTDWSRRDSTAYLSHYSPRFVPADGRNYESWAASRRKNLDNRKDIQVALLDVQVALLDESKATVRFAQDYAAGNYRETGQAKTLTLERQGGQWLIVSEWQGAPPASSKR